MGNAIPTAGGVVLRLLLKSLGVLLSPVAIRLQPDGSVLAKEADVIGDPVGNVMPKGVRALSQ